MILADSSFRLAALKAIISTHTMESLQGHFLIASPHLSDPNFFHTVVLLVQHNEDGALGVVLNRPTETRVAQVWQQVSESTCLIEGMIHQGGPCEGPLMVLHDEVADNDLAVLPGVTFTTNKDTIQQLIESGSDPTRFFIGYAGWSAGQLESEMKTGSWVTLKADATSIFDPSDDLWHDLHRKVAISNMASWIPPSMIPDDPSLN